MTISEIIASSHTIAIVGLSDKPERYSHQVATYLQSKGFRIIPVNPLISHVLGENAYPTIASIPADISIDIVDIFRRSELVLPHVTEAVSRAGVKLIWLQEGVENEEAAHIAKQHNIPIVMNACLMVQHNKLHS